MLRGERQLVTEELAKMHRFLLAPLGVASAPASLNEAVAAYQPARAQAMDALGVVVQQELGRQARGSSPASWRAHPDLIPGSRGRSPGPGFGNDS
jgi:hypothetical protein